MSTFNEVKNRWLAPMPAFFKKVLKMGMGASAAGMGLVSPTLVPGVHWPPILTTIGGGLIIAGTVAGSISKLTVDDSNSKP